MRDYSLGMKQRLGIAIALLPDPEVLVLDEPTNGLDPAGIVEIRALIRALGDEGRTVLVSSHLLSEIEAAADRLVVIRFGELLFSGPLSTLIAQERRFVDVEPEAAADRTCWGATASWASSRRRGRCCASSTRHARRTSTAPPSTGHRAAARGAAWRPSRTSSCA